MYKVGDEVVVVKVDSKNKIDYLDKMYTIQAKRDGKYRLWDYWFDNTNVPLFSDDELRLATDEDRIEEIKKDVSRLRKEMYSMENRIEMNYKKKSEDKYWNVNLINIVGAILMAAIIVLIIVAETIG